MIIEKNGLTLHVQARPLDDATRHKLARLDGTDVERTFYSDLRLAGETFLNKVNEAPEIAPGVSREWIAARHGVPAGELD